MQLKDKIFEKYYQTQGKYLEGDTAAKQQWCNNLCEASYAKHLEKGKILEIGCNRGYILKWLHGEGLNDIEGIDLSPADVELAKKHTGLENIFCADAFEYLKEKENAYDCIISKDVLGRIEKNKLDEFLILIRGALKTKGKLILQVPNMDWIMAQHERYMDLTHEIRFTRESLGELLPLYFDDVRIFPVNYDFPSSKKSKIAFGLIKPITIKLTRILLTMLGGGAGACWLEYREILGVARKK